MSSPASDVAAAVWSLLALDDVAVAAVDPEAALVGGSEGDAPVVDAADAGGRSGVSVDEESTCHEDERVL